MSNRRYRNIYLDNRSHFCTASTVDRLPMLNDESICHSILKCWEKQRARWNVRIEGFVIMPNHVHILVRGLAEDVRKFMQYSLAESSRSVRVAVQLKAKAGDLQAINWLKEIHDRANGGAQGKVWKERSRCVALDIMEAVLVKLEYIHRNPVIRELVAEPGEWKWSSYRHYFGGACGMRVDDVGL